MIRDNCQEAYTSRHARIVNNNISR